MSYNAYLKFYGLKDTDENRVDWLFSLWNKGNVYMYEGKFFDVETGKEVK